MKPGYAFPAGKNICPEEDGRTGCGLCGNVRRHGAIRMEDGKAKKQENCIGCGYCFGVCPTGALAVAAGKIVSDILRRHGI